MNTPKVNVNTKWSQNGVSAAGGNGRGSGLDQLWSPEGVYIDDDQTLYVADYNNNRIVEWELGATSGRVVAGGNGKGNRIDQLNGPTDVTVDKKNNCLIICDYRNKRVVRWPRRHDTSGEIIISNIDCWGLVIDGNGCLYISDCQKCEVRRWRDGDTTGIVVAGGNRSGSGLNQLFRPTYLRVDQDNSLYISDRDNHRVMKWVEGAKEGIIVAGGQSKGNMLTQLSSPYGIAVDQVDTVYVADFDNHRVICWPKGATQGRIIVGGNGPGGQAKQLNCPVGLSFDRQGNLYVIDFYNHRIQTFDICST